MPGRRAVARFRTALTAVGLGLVLGPLAGLTPAAADPDARDDAWYLKAMDVTKAHEEARGDGVTVAVVDSGVDATHRDLRGQVLDGTVIGSGDGTAHDDTDGHGTAMASLIAGRGGGRDRVLGVAPRARILPVRLTQNGQGKFAMDTVYAGVRWAIDHGAKVVNLSVGGAALLSDEQRAEVVQYALDHDVVLVAAAGNTGDGDQKVTEPGAIPGVVAVSGTQRGDRFWKGSAHGPEVVVAAPAQGIPVAVPTGVERAGYALADGTSGATALVSGTVALIRSKYPRLSASNVINRLIRTSEDLGPDGRDDRFGFGAVNAHRAVTADVPHSRTFPLALPPGVTSPVEEEPAPKERQAADGPRVPAGSLALVATVVIVLVGAAAVGVLVLLVRAVRAGARPVPAAPPGVPGGQVRVGGPIMPGQVMPGRMMPGHVMPGQQGGARPMPPAAPGALVGRVREPETVQLAVPYRRADDHSRPAKPVYPDTPLKPVCPRPSVR